MPSRSDHGGVEILQGTLHLGILRALRWEPALGRAFAKAIGRGSIRFDDADPQNNRRARSSRFTANRPEQVEIETSRRDPLTVAPGRNPTPCHAGARTS